MLTGFMLGMFSRGDRPHLARSANIAGTEQSGLRSCGFTLCRVFVVALALMVHAGTVEAQAQSPWGLATAAPPQQYAASKAVYDVAVSTPQALDSLLDRISGLNAEYSHDPFEASIVVVLHGPELKFFDIRNFAQYETQVRRAQSLSVGTAIHFRACQRSARNQGIAPENLHGFLELVPMADAEIVKLQQQGYAYMR